MSKNEEKQIEMELEFKRKQFINEVSLTSQVIGVEVDFYIRPNEKGHLLPYMHLKKTEPLTEEKKIELIEVLDANRTAWMKMLGFQDTAIDPKEWGIKYITPGTIEDTEKEFMNVLDKLEREYELTMKPVVVGSMDGIVGSYDVVEKIFEKKDDVEKKVDSTEEKV